MSYKNENGKILILSEQGHTKKVATYSSDDEEQPENTLQQNSNSEEERSDYDYQEVFSKNSYQFYTIKYKKTDWLTQPLRICESVKPENTIEHKPGVNLIAQNSKTELECWNNFISNDMMDQILCHTNNKIKETQMANPYLTRCHLFQETTKEELLAFLGLMYLAGLTHSNRQTLHDFWRTDGTGMDIFRTTMSLERFCFLNTSLFFDDPETYIERKRVDNLASIRSIFNKFVSNCQNAYVPSKCLTINKKNIIFRGKHSLRQKVMKKSAKPNMIMYALVDAKSFYTVNLEIDSDEQSNEPFMQSNKAFNVVDRLVQPISKSNRNVTFDKWFTSIPLVQYLLKKHNLTSTGTLRTDIKQIPPYIITARNRKLYSSYFAFQKDITLVSYVPKKSKVILAVSTLHHDKSIDPASGNEQIPKIISFYNSTKAGYDEVDDIFATYDISQNSKRWPTTVFFMFMKIAAINGLILYRENNKSKRNTRDFLRKLGFLLLESYLHRRKNANKQVGAITNDPPHVQPKTLKRCKICPPAKDKKSKYECRKCQKSICMEHDIILCQNCIGLNRY